MNFVSHINIQGFNIPTITLFLLIGLLGWFFVMWSEGRKDGFNDERLFDLSFILLTLSTIYYIFMSWYLGRLAIYDPFSKLLWFDKWFLLIVVPFILNIFPIVSFAKKWKWSKYRVLDIYAMSITYLSLLMAAGIYFIYGNSLLIVPIIGIFPLFHLFVLNFRGHRFRSGVIFSIFLFLVVAYIAGFYRHNGYLIFCGLLSTISLINLYFRKKKTMMKRALSKEFLDTTKGKLQKKDKELKQEHNRLVAEDPYLQEGRDMDNSNEMDEAILEDVEKEITDLELDFVTKFRLQVKKALSRLNIGKYGICETCGTPIEKARLDFYPQATLCLSCSKKSEK